MPALIHTIYASRATSPFDTAALHELARKAGKANERAGLTGLLLHEEGNFFQLLEGPPAAVDATYARICQDMNHRAVTRIVREPVDKRTFSEWSMAFTEMTRSELRAIDGIGEFFAHGAVFTQLDRERALRVMHAFANGRWRQKIVERAVRSSQRSPDLVAGASDGALPAAPLMHVSPMGISYAFQPIVDSFACEVVSYEALIRGARGESAFQVLSAVPPAELYRFDAEGRVAAIEMASRLGIRCDLNLNFLPQSAFVSQAMIESTVEAALRFNISLDRIVIEVTESEAIQDHRRFADLISTYRRQGVKVAIDDFGAGHSGLNLLADFQPDQIKVDIALVRRIEADAPRQSIVRAIIGLCHDLRIDVIAEGIESLEELRWLEGEGLCLFQGYLFAKPGFEHLPTVVFPERPLPRNLLLNAYSKYAQAMNLWPGTAA